jgi:acylphosphatase
MPRSAIHLVVHGRVQGVGYRWWTQQAALRLGLDGWVRNRTDGTVELLAIGEPAMLEQLAQACRQGPSAARVAHIRRDQATDDGSAGFETLATA